MAELSNLLDTLKLSLESAFTSLPDPSSISPPTEGISLFDTKNELILSYLQNLVFLIVLKLRNTASLDEQQTDNLDDVVTKKLVELRVYLEKGVRPLEAKLKYQLDKLLLAATDAQPVPTANAPKAQIGKTAASDDIEDSEDDNTAPAQISDLAHRPNPAAFARPSESRRYADRDNSDVYRPPRITPTALPTTERKVKAAARPRKSAVLEEFAREEMGDAPVAEASIGAGSGLRGRSKEKEDERTGYEEQRLIRLPEEKKGKKKDKRRGEDLTGGFASLGDIDFGDRGRDHKKRKREAGTESRIGEAWEKRVKKGLGKKRR